MQPRSSHPPPPNLTGQTIADRYQLGDALGEGGFGVVYRARDTWKDCAVAVKVMREELGTRGKLQQRFVREGKALMALDHPHIVHVTDTGLAGEMPFLVMELLKGRPLDVALREGPLPADRALRLMKELLEGIAYMHGQGLVHRDLKPGNIYLQDTGGRHPRVKLLDFGLAKFVEKQGHQGDMATLTRTGEVFGTPAYMPPEQLVSGKVDHRADIYAATVVLFEMLAGRRPFEGEPHEVLRLVLVEPPPPLVRHDDPARARPELQAFIDRGMAKEAEDRFQSAQEMFKALKSLRRPWMKPQKGGITTVRNIGTADTIKAHGLRPSAETAPPDAAASPGVVAVVRSGLRRTLVMLATLVSVVALVVIAAAGLTIKRLSDGEPVDLPPPVLELLAGFVEQPAVEAAGSAEPRDANTRDEDRDGESAAAQPGDEDRETSPEETAQPGASTAAAGTAGEEAEPTIEAVEPLDLPAARDILRRNLPSNLRAIRRKLDRNPEGNDRIRSALRLYNRQHPKDVRGHLLLARLYMGRSWYRDALGQYEIVLDGDPAARGTRDMLEDLVLLSTLAPTGGAATQRVLRYYGKDASKAVDKLLATEDNDGRRQRLMAMKSRLQSM